MSSGAKNKKAEELKKKLLSEDETVVISAISEAEDNGNADMVIPLISLYAATASDEVRKKISGLLSTLKVSAAEAHFMDALSNPEFKHIRKDIIGFIWSSGFQPVNELAVISGIAIDGNFEEALECITLVDSIENSVPEAVLLESITLVKQHLSNSPKNDKTALMTQYLLALENMRMEE